MHPSPGLTPKGSNLTSEDVGRGLEITQINASNSIARSYTIHVRSNVQVLHAFIIDDHLPSRQRIYIRSGRENKG